MYIIFYGILRHAVNLDKNYNILVAKCGRTIGLNGELKLIIYTDFIEIFTKDIKLFCNGNILTINKFDYNRMVIKFREINNIDNAKILNSKLLYMNRQDTLKYCNKKSDEYFWFDIIDCEVFDHDVLIGNVIDITRMGSTDYLIVKTNKDLLTKLNLKVYNFMIPCINRYISNVDVKMKIIKTIDTIGILENS